MPVDLVRPVVDLDPVVADRILKATSFQEPDRVPIWDYLDNHATIEHFRQPGDSYDQAMVRTYHGLGIDLCRGYGRSWGLEDEGHIHQSEDGKQEFKVLGRTQWQTRRRICSVQEITHFRPEPPTDAWIYDEWIPHWRKQMEAFAPQTLVVIGHPCGFHAAYDTMGIELFSYALYDAPWEVQRLVKTYADGAARMAKAAAEARLGPLYFIGDDIAYKSGLIFSPEVLREYFLPALLQCCEPLKRAGIKVIFHSDGNLMGILDELIGVGIDGLNPIEPIAGMDIGFLKRKYGHRLILVGNVDCSITLPLKTPEEVAEATKSCIRAASPGGGHFIGSSSEVTPSTPLENVLTFYRTIHESGTYPIRC